MGLLKKWFKRHTHNIFFYGLRQLGRSANFLYENYNYDTESNGEERLIRSLARLSQGSESEVIFDVGANVGRWSTMVRSYFPKAKIYAFEMVEETYRSLVKNTEGKNIHCFQKGLSDQSETKKIFSFQQGHELSTVYAFAQNEQARRVEVQMTTGDEFMETHSISRIHLLKIDTEGHDLHVLKGFSKALRAQKIDVIQFEYGKINIVSKSLLYDFYQFLDGLGYEIGKIYPQTIEFKSYLFKMEDFIGPNYVAVLREKVDLKVGICS